MKQQRHKRKESFSILLMSNIGGSSRQLHFSMTALRLLFVVLLIICIAIISLTFLFSSEKSRTSSLNKQLAEKDETIQQLETEIEALTEEKQRLAKENMDMLMAGSGSEEEEEAVKADETAKAEPETDSSFPSLYPSSETGMVIDIFSEERPYLSFNTHVDTHVIAAGDGMVVVISSDDTYPLILEVEHASGHRTRYMCRQEAVLNTEIGAQVSAGDTLITITADNTQLDYQVIFEGEIIDPFNVIDAKG
ncbi:MAG: hypothetical protein NC400_13510 [Clostridium sp.]|nr:hypothetical protein [Clostridium sp.]